MAKKIKFPLEMKNGVMVRTLEELNENFNFEKLILYYKTGKLLIWLEDRYYDYEAEQLKQLNIEEHDFNKKLCDIFKVEYSKDFEVDIEELERKNKRLSKLKQYTNDEEILKNINNIAFNQEELIRFIYEDIKEIYLFGERFHISINKENIKYIGINKPTIFLDVNEKVEIDLDEKNIIFENVHISSQSNIKIKFEKSNKITFDEKNIKIGLKIEKLITTIDISNSEEWHERKNYLYKDLLISISSSVFDIYNIYSMKKVCSFDDIKKDNWSWYSRVRIDSSQIYKNYIIMYFGKYESGGKPKLMKFNLDTLSIETLIVAPEGHDGNSNIYIADYIDIWDDKIILYQKNNTYHRIEHQYHDFRTGKFIESKSLNIEEIKYHKANVYDYIYLGNIYSFSAIKMKIVSTNKKYECNGFHKTNNKNKGSIGNFIICNDKVIATHCEEKASKRLCYDSAIDIGNISIYNYNGGYPEKTIEISDKKIIDIKKVNNNIVCICESSPTIYFYDDINFELNNKINLDLSLSKDNRYGCRISDINFDENTNRLVVTYNGIIAIYK